MAYDLMSMAQNDKRPTSRERKVAQRAQTFYDDVQFAKFVASGFTNLGKHDIENLRELDMFRMLMAGGDPAAYIESGEIKAEVVKLMRASLRKLGDDWVGGASQW